MKWFILAIKRSFDFKGRSGRAEFWYYTLIYTLFYILGFVFLAIIPKGNIIYWALSGISLLLVLLLLIPTISVQIRRLHDTDRSGFFILLSMIPIIGPCVLIYFFTQHGSEGPNQYGELET